MKQITMNCSSLKNIFQQFDKQGRGNLALSDFRTMLKSVNK